MPKLLKTNTAVVQIPEKVLSAKGRQIKSTTSKGNISRKSINIETGGDKVKVIKEGDYAEPPEKKKRTYKKKEPVVKKEPIPAIVKKPDDTKKKNEAATKIAGAVKAKKARKEMAEKKKDAAAKKEMAMIEQDGNFPTKVKYISYMSGQVEYLPVKEIENKEKFKPEGNITVDEYKNLYNKALLLVDIDNENQESGTIKYLRVNRTEDGTTVGLFIPFQNYFKPLYRNEFTKEEFDKLEDYLIDGLLYVIIENYKQINPMKIYTKGKSFEYYYLIVPYMRKWIDDSEYNKDIALSVFDTADTMIKYKLKRPPANPTAYKLNRVLNDAFSNPKVLKKLTKLMKELK